MLLAVFREFAHPEVLEKVQGCGICDVEVASQPNPLASSAEELRVLRTNAKLITVTHNIAGMRDVFDNMSCDELATLDEEVNAKVAALEKLGFVVQQRRPKTSAGFAMLDRVILSYPE